MTTVYASGFIVAEKSLFLVKFPKSGKSLPNKKQIVFSS
jgi:hypothetical protein